MIFCRKASFARPSRGSAYLRSLGAEGGDRGRRAHLALTFGPLFWSRNWWALALLIASSASEVRAQDVKDPIFWLTRANDKMNLRMPGAAPFHMKVAFHALPGMEMLPKGKTQILTGDGVYEETWLAPHEWRREVALGSYHATESQINGVRKMQASSDYVPGRVWMLLNTLMNPISPYELAPEKHDRARHWKLEQISAGSQPLVRISRMFETASLTRAGEAYVFLPDGRLLQSNENDILTIWQNDTILADKLVPKHLSVWAGKDRELLDAEVAVGSVGRADPAALDLPGEPADPGITLRPLHAYDVRPPEPPPGHIAMNVGPGSPTTDQGLFVHVYVDRRGRVRDAEIITFLKRGSGEPLDAAQSQIDDIREWRFRPAEIDGSKCEVEYGIIY
jgi:hypothetical protein